MSKWDKETAEWYAEHYGEYPTNRLLGPAHRHYRHTRHPEPAKDLSETQR